MIETLCWYKFDHKKEIILSGLGNKTYNSEWRSQPMTLSHSVHLVFFSSTPKEGKVKMMGEAFEPNQKKENH